MTTLTIGPIHTLTQNVVYAMPPRNVRVQSNVALEISQDGTNFIALTGANTVGVDSSAAFVRSTTGNALVTVKAT